MIASLPVPRSLNPQDGGRTYAISLPSASAQLPTASSTGVLLDMAGRQAWQFVSLGSISQVLDYAMDAQQLQLKAQLFGYVGQGSGALYLMGNGTILVVFSTYMAVIQ